MAARPCGGAVAGGDATAASEGGMEGEREGVAPSRPAKSAARTPVRLRVAAGAGGSGGRRVEEEEGAAGAGAGSASSEPDPLPEEELEDDVQLDPVPELV